MRSDRTVTFSSNARQRALLQALPRKKASVADTSLRSYTMCGNFGLLLLLPLERKETLALILRMLKITSVRGAQSAGIVTYERMQSGDAVGLRSRVVNGKRTDLGELLLAKLAWALRGAAFPNGAETSRLFQGHTRFATSSICNLAGCHPHQWLPSSAQLVWRLTAAGRFVCEKRTVESYITHNGDLDFFAVNGVTYALSDVQALLARLLGRPMPSDVDSACVAGLLDLLRTKGIWVASVRYAYLYGALADSGSLCGCISDFASASQIARLAAVFQAKWADLVNDTTMHTHIESACGERCACPLRYDIFPLPCC